MRGPEFVVDTLLAHVQARIPPRLAAIRAELGVDLVVLPEVASWHTPRDVDLIPVEEFPAVMVSLLEVTTIVDEGNAGGGAREYVLRYRFRVYVFARGEGADETHRARSRYLRAAREAVLEGQHRPLTGAAGPVVAPVRLTGYRESLSEVDTVRTGASVAAAYLEAELDLSELLSAP